MKYLTPQQYRLADDGLFTDVKDLTLARFIARAETDIDAFMEFDLTRGGFEPHQVWMQGQFDEETLKMEVPSYPVPVRQVTRYRIQVSNLSTTGAGFFADINPGDVVINQTRGYVEIVPLQAVTYSLSPILLQLGLRPPITQLDCEVGFYLPVFGEQLLSLDSTNTTFVALRGFWQTSYDQALATQPYVLPPIPPVIYVDGVASTAYSSINYTEGTVTFPASMQGHTIAADYTYAIPDDVRDATIDQVTYLLGLRALNQMGFQGLAQMRNGDVELRTAESFPARFQTDTGALCDRAARRLQHYKPIPIA
jgi:hypothetical protein